MGLVAASRVPPPLVLMVMCFSFWSKSLMSEKDGSAGQLPKLTFIIPAFFLSA
jgi:hypothetical protein